MEWSIYNILQSLNEIVQRENISINIKVKYLLNVKNVSGQKKVREYDQEIPQSQTADNPMAPRGRAAQPPGDTRKTN